jgi:hypothetical protein
MCIVSSRSKVFQTPGGELLLIQKAPLSNVRAEARLSIAFLVVVGAHQPSQSYSIPRNDFGAGACTIHGAASSWNDPLNKRPHHTTGGYSAKIPFEDAVSQRGEQYHQPGNAHLSSRLARLLDQTVSSASLSIPSARFFDQHSSWASLFVHSRLFTTFRVSHKHKFPHKVVNMESVAYLDDVGASAPS